MGGKTTPAHRKKWKLANPDKVRAWYKTEKGREHGRRTTASMRRRRPMHMLVQGARSNAKRRGLEHILEDKFFDGVTTCALSGLAFVKGCPLYGPSIDRIDNTKGYLPTNVRLILLCLNRLKGVGTDAEILKIVNAVVCHQGEPK